MENFKYSIPTEIYFGKNQITNLDRIKEYGDKVLLVYGGGSIKKNGVYNSIHRIMEKNDIELFELGHVDPNPRIESVRAGAEICKAKGVKAVLAAGGGSTIDCAKVIAAAAKYDGDAWDLVLDGSKIKEALPIVALLTISATGSEMDEYAVISDMSKNDKLDTSSELLKPKFSILDPQYTYSVPAKQTAAGTADIMSHVFESYFTNVPGAYLQKSLCESILKTCIKYAPIALEAPENYEARANLMWSSSLALNGLLAFGNPVGWSVHAMEHELSAYYDVTHGEGLAVLTPCWMEYILSEDTLDDFVRYGEEVWKISSIEGKWHIAKKAIKLTREFFERLGLPRTLSDLDIGEDKLEEMAGKLEGHFDSAFVPMTSKDVLSIYRKAL